MFLRAYLYLKRKTPKWKGWLFKLLFQTKRLQIGRNFQCETFPSILLTENGSVEIGDNVLLRRQVEFRSHGHSRIKVGNHNRIDRGVRILAANSSTITLKDNVRVGLYSVMNGGDSIIIGEKSLISGFVYLQTSLHKHEGGQTVQDQGYSHAPISLGNDVWIGTHATILPGCDLADGAVVGSNSVVTKPVLSDEVVGGVPARKIKDRSHD